jgi:hypothetical protein
MRREGGSEEKINQEKEFILQLLIGNRKIQLSVPSYEEVEDREVEKEEEY